MIYHITTENAWQSALKEQSYAPENFQADGFIHCSDHYQLENTANRFYNQTPGLIVLEIDPEKLTSNLVYENLEGGQMPFPHIYGKLNLDAVVATFHFDRNQDGRLTLPEGRKHPEPSLLTEFPFHLAGKVFRSPTPGSRMFDPENKVLGLFKEKGINTVVVLNDEDEHVRHTGRLLLKRYRQAGYRIIYAPIPDFSAPESGYWDEAIAETIQAIQNGENVVIHCHAGIGRTGIFVALMASQLLDLDGEQAVAWVRQTVPYAIDTQYQRSFVLDEIKRKRNA